MSRADRPRLPRGVTRLPRPRGGRAYRASIRKGKAGEVHLGLYETAWLAAFAHEIAAKALRREGGPTLEIPHADQPTPDQVAEIAERVHRRLGLVETPRREPEFEPTPDELMMLFEVTVVGFWRGEADQSWDDPDRGLDAAAGRLIAAADLIFWRRGPRHPSPIDVMGRLLGRRLETSFRRSDLTRAVLDDDGDDPWRVARWLVYPETPPGGRGRGFRDEVVWLYGELFEVEATAGPMPWWAAVLGVSPPFSLDRIKAAYRARSRLAHPDVGGSDSDFIALQSAYDAARAQFGAG